MTLNVKTIGFINFNKEYNRKFTNGTITVSVAHGVKQQDGSFKNEYINGYIPAKLVSQFKPLINEKLVDIEGVIEIKNGYTNLVILDAKEHKKEEEEEEEEKKKTVTKKKTPTKKKELMEIEDDDLPF